MAQHIIRDSAGNYHIKGATERDILDLAAKILQAKKLTDRDIFSNPKDVKRFLQTALGTREHEVFAALFLDNKHRLIEYEVLFTGTIDQAAIHPREVVKRALQLNAAALIVSHNHPSGDTNPSDSDLRITNRLKDALNLVDMRLLDHIIVSGERAMSLAERGRL